MGEGDAGNVPARQFRSLDGLRRRLGPARALRRRGASGPLQTTWSFNGTTWTKFALSISPSARRTAAMAYDQATQQLVPSAGQRQGICSRQPGRGTDRVGHHSAPLPAPSARSSAGIAYDDQSDQVVLFAGGGTSGKLSTTWAFDGGRWQELTTGTAPSARSGAALAYDAAVGENLMFGGEGMSGVLSTSWMLAPTTVPPMDLTVAEAPGSDGSAQELFAVSGGAAYEDREAPGGSWSGWALLGGEGITSSLTYAPGADGSVQEIFAVANGSAYVDSGERPGELVRLLRTGWHGDHRGPDVLPGLEHISPRAVLSCRRHDVRELGGHGRRVERLGDQGSTVVVLSQSTSIQTRRTVYGPAASTRAHPASRTTLPTLAARSGLP